jgi:cathepsin D
MVQYPAGGVVGLAFPSISKLDAPPLFSSLLRNRQKFNPIFSFKLSSSEAEMWVGGTNRLLYDGDITYTPVTNPVS